MNFEILQQYVKNIREIFEQKLAEMQMFQDRQAAEIEALTNKIMTLGLVVVLLIVVIIILVIVLKASGRRRERDAMERREEALRREERQLREERRRLAQQQEQQIRQSQAWPDRSRQEWNDRPAQMRPNGQVPEWSDRPSNTPSHEYGRPSRREYPGRQDDRAARDGANRETQYFNDPEDWK